MCADASMAAALEMALLAALDHPAEAEFARLKVRSALRA
jgi:hypothetical protein